MIGTRQWNLNPTHHKAAWHSRPISLPVQLCGSDWKCTGYWPTLIHVIGFKMAQCTSKPDMCMLLYTNEDVRWNIAVRFIQHNLKWRIVRRNQIGTCYYTTDEVQCDIVITFIWEFYDSICLHSDWEYAVKPESHSSLGSMTSHPISLPVASGMDWRCVRHSLPS